MTVSSSTSSSTKQTYNFPASSRVKKRSSFLIAQKSGKKLRTGSFLVCVYKSDIKIKDEKTNSDTTISRLGITVTTKVHKKATERNKLKRRIREIFRVSYPNIRKGFDFVVIAQVGATDLSFKEIKDQILNTLTQARLLKLESSENK